MNNYGTLTFGNSTVSGDAASSQDTEVYNASSEYLGTIVTNAFNLFGHDGRAGVYGFVPAVTDLVPAVPLSAILGPALAANGGPTRTHALVTLAWVTTAGDNVLGRPA